MDSKQFFTQLAFVTLSTSVVLAILHFILPPMQTHWKFSIAAIVLFVVVCVGLFYAGQSTSKSRSKLAFNNVISLSVFGKMAVSIGFLFLYRSVANPENQWFVLPFLLVYAVFTVFEIVFMTRLARQ